MLAQALSRRLAARGFITAGSIVAVDLPRQRLDGRRHGPAGRADPAVRARIRLERQRNFERAGACASCSSG